MKVSFVISILIFLNLSSAFSNGIGIVNGATGTYLTTKESNTVVKVIDQIAITTITQVLQNNSDNAVNIKYGFPLNESANSTKLRWNYNNIWKEAIVSSLPQDNSLPGGEGSNSIQQELIDYLGDYPLFFSPNDTIAAGAIITIELTYVELLPYFLGKVSYDHKNDISSLQSDIIDKQTFRLELESDREVLSFELLNLESEVETNGNLSIVTFNRDESIGDYDYTVEYELNSNTLGMKSVSTMLPDSLFTCDSLGNGFVSFIIEPESNVNTDVIEKNFSLIIDRSGSMSGDKIIQAKDAATFIVQNLNFGDYFNIIDFSSEVSSFRDELVEYSNEVANDALAYIDNIEAGGSTNISESLITSINQFNVVSEDKANIIIFCTDGHATAGETSTKGILSLIETEVLSTEKDVFLFTIGIGEGLDQALLTLLARQNSGLVQFIDPNSLEEDLVKFFLSINNPVLLNTEITFSPDVIDEIYPFPYPNLYKGQQLILSARYQEAETVNINLKGKAFNIPVNYDFQLSLSDTTNNSVSFLPKLWAKQKLDVLGLDYYLVETQEERDHIAELIDSLSACYGVIATEFTSFDDTTTEVNEIDTDVESSQISYYPNPISDVVEINTKGIIKNNANVIVEIFSINSQNVYKSEHQVIDGILRIQDLEYLEAGIYFLTIYTESKIFVIKVVKSSR